MEEELVHALPPGKIHLPPDHKEERNQTLVTVTLAIYLGVTIHQDLSWNEHVNGMSKRNCWLPEKELEDKGH